MIPFRCTFIYIFVSLFSIAVVINGCSEDPVSEQQAEETDTVIRKDSVTGVVQKGPFNSGSNVTLFELNEADLSQTGRSFTVQVRDNQGQFEINNIELEAPYAGFRADGFYFNEILGRQSASQITLNAIADVEEESGININVLSHLEKPRIEYLVSEGVAFEEAKIQAQSEVLSVFHIVNGQNTPSEKMNIASEGEDHAILLAVSSILQGYRSEAELSEMLSFMIADLRENGELNDDDLGSELINHAIYLRSDLIRSNLEERYSDLGVSIEIPDFASYIANFIENTPFEITERLIEYPPEGSHGVNLLDPDRSIYNSSNNVYGSLAANLAEGTSLKIRISTLEGEPSGMDSMWAYRTSSPVNWEVRQYDYGAHTQEFIALESGKSSDLEIRISHGRFLVEYFEMDPDAEEPAWTREFEVTD